MTFGPDYDRWLESERDRLDCENDAYNDWCDENDLDPDDDNYDDWQQYIDDEREQAQIDRADALREERMLWPDDDY